MLSLDSSKAAGNLESVIQTEKIEDDVTARGGLTAVFCSRDGCPRWVHGALGRWSTVVPLGGDDSD